MCDLESVNYKLMSIILNCLNNVIIYSYLQNNFFFSSSTFRVNELKLVYKTFITFIIAKRFKIHKKRNNNIAKCT